MLKIAHLKMYIDILIYLICEILIIQIWYRKLMSHCSGITHLHNV